LNTTQETLAAVQTTKPRSSGIFLCLQAGRGIAALIVVLHHCADLLSTPKYGGAERWRIAFLSGHSGVEFFFVLSGIVILNAHRHDLGRPGRFVRYLGKRFRRIYPLYWIVLAIEAAVFLTHPAMGSGTETLPATLLQSALLMHITSTHTVVLVSWTLFHEILFYAVFSIAIVNAVIGRLTLALWMCAAGLTLLWPIANPVLAMYLSPLNVMFGFGMLVILFVSGKGSEQNPAARHAGLIAALGTAAFAGVAITETALAHELPILNVTYGLCAAIALVGWMLMERQGRLNIPRWLLFFGDASYAIYLTHHTVVSFLAKGIAPVALRHHVPIAVTFTCLAAGATLVGSAVHLLLERPFLLPRRSPQRS